MMALRGLFLLSLALGFLANVMDSQVIYGSPPPPAVICTACATCENPCTPVPATLSPPPPAPPAVPKTECPPPPYGYGSPPPPGNPNSLYPYYPYYRTYPSTASPVLCRRSNVTVLLQLVFLPLIHFVLKLSL